MNICDTARFPDSMGIRASMPGNGTDQRMWMRFSAEDWSRSLQGWTAVSGSGISPWVYAGSAQYARRQAGWTFAFSAPPDGVAFTMRAHVEFEWRAKPLSAARRAAKSATAPGSFARSSGPPKQASKGRRRRSGRHPKAACLVY